MKYTSTLATATSPTVLETKYDINSSNAQKAVTTATTPAKATTTTATATVRMAATVATPANPTISETPAKLETVATTSVAPVTIITAAIPATTSAIYQLSLFLRMKCTSTSATTTTISM